MSNKRAFNFVSWLSVVNNNGSRVPIL